MPVWLQTQLLNNYSSIQIDKWCVYCFWKWKIHWCNFSWFNQRPLTLLIITYYLINFILLVPFRILCFGWTYTFTRDNSVSASKEVYHLIVEKGVPLGSSLGPLIFSIFNNDHPKICSDYHVQLYADDIVIYTSNADRFEIERSLQREFAFAQNWFSSNKLLLNKNKSCSMLFGTILGLGGISDLTIKSSFWIWTSDYF